MSFVFFLCPNPFPPISNQERVELLLLRRDETKKKLCLLYCCCSGTTPINRAGQRDFVHHCRTPLAQGSTDRSSFCTEKKEKPEMREVWMPAQVDHSCLSSFIPKSFRFISAPAPPPLVVLIGVRFCFGSWLFSSWSVSFGEQRSTRTKRNYGGGWTSDS